MGSSLRDLINLVDLSITQAVVDRRPVIQRLNRTGTATLRNRHFNDADDQTLIGREFAADHLFQGAAVRTVQRCDIDFQVRFHASSLPRIAAPRIDVEFGNLDGNDRSVVVELQQVLACQAVVCSGGERSFLAALGTW